jgi:hypothetical protein
MLQIPFTFIHLISVLRWLKETILIIMLFIKSRFYSIDIMNSGIFLFMYLFILKVVK